MSQRGGELSRRITIADYETGAEAIGAKPSGSQ
jgi:hypothetical protein